MPNPTTSPSEFIYRRIIRGSPCPEQSILETSAMELAESRILGSCQKHQSLPFIHTPREAVVGPESPSFLNARRNATWPTTQFTHGYENEQQGLSYGAHAPPPDVLPPCLPCHHETEALCIHAPGPARVTAINHFKTEPVSLPSPTTYPQYDGSVASSSRLQSVFPSPALPATSVQDLTSSKDEHPPPASPTLDDRTVSVGSSNSERTSNICIVVATAHDICLQSTKTYLDSHRANHRARTSNLLPLHSRLKVSEDGGDITSITNDINDNANKGVADPCPIPPPTGSLLANVSTICSMLWEGSQRDRLDVLDVERAAVDTMGRLLLWAETVALGDYDEWNVSDEAALRNVLEAGQSLCAWLRVPDGIQAMEGLKNNAIGPGYRDYHGI